MSSSDGPRPSTACLIRRLVAGDASVLVEILQVHGPPLRRFLERRYRRLLRDDDVHDALTSTLMYLWLYRSQAAQITSLKNWLWTVADRTAATVARSPRGKARRLELPLPADAAQLATRFSEDVSRPTRETQARLEALEIALRQLSAAQRRIVLFDASRTNTARSIRELSEELHLAPATIRTHRRRAIRKLRKLLSEIERFGVCTTTTAREIESHPDTRYTSPPPPPRQRNDWGWMGRARAGQLNVFFRTGETVC